MVRVDCQISSNIQPQAMVWADSVKHSASGNGKSRQCQTSSNIQLQGMVRVDCQISSNIQPQAMVWADSVKHSASGNGTSQQCQTSSNKHMASSEVWLKTQVVIHPPLSFKSFCKKCRSDFWRHIFSVSVNTLMVEKFTKSMSKQWIKLWTLCMHARLWGHCNVVL